MRRKRSQCVAQHLQPNFIFIWQQLTFTKDTKIINQIEFHDTFCIGCVVVVNFINYFSTRRCRQHSCVGRTSPTGNERTQTLDAMKDSSAFVDIIYFVLEIKWQFLALFGLFGSAFHAWRTRSAGALARARYTDDWSDENDFIGVWFGTSDRRSLAAKI